VKGIDTADLLWSPVTSGSIDIYRNRGLIRTVSNTGTYTDSTGQKGNNSFTYEVCAAGTQNCSNQVAVRFGGPR
jgi:serine protease